MIWNLQHYRYHKGFTLVEMLVVISIVSMLSSIILASENSARHRAGNAATLRLVHQYHLALELYKTNDPSGSYPTLSPISQGVQVCLGSYPGGECGSGTCNGGVGACPQELPSFSNSIKNYIPGPPPFKSLLISGVPGVIMFTGATYFCASLVNGVCQQYGIIFLLKGAGQSCGDLGIGGGSAAYGDTTICDSRY